MIQSIGKVSNLLKEEQQGKQKQRHHVKKFFRCGFSNKKKSMADNEQKTEETQEVQDNYKVNTAAVKKVDELLNRDQNDESLKV